MVPFGLTNYILGCTTSIEYGPYCIGTLAIIVKTAVFTFIGASLYTLTTDGKKKEYDEKLLVMCEVLLTICLSFYLSYKAKEFLDTKMNEKSA